MCERCETPHHDYVNIINWFDCISGVNNTELRRFGGRAKLCLCERGPTCHTECAPTKSALTTC